MVKEPFVKSPEVFRRKKSLRRRCSEMFKRKNLTKVEDLRACKSDSYLHRNALFRRSLISNIGEKEDIRKTTFQESADDFEPVRPRRNSILRRSIDNFNHTTKTVHRRISRSNKDIREHFSKIKVEECLPVTIKSSENQTPILRSNETIVEDIVIWEESWRKTKSTRRKTLLRLI